MNRLTWRIAAVVCLLAAPPARAGHNEADPFCGTTHDGGLFPGATAPFGMVQWSPDTGKHPTLAGYNYRDSSMDGFSFVHLSGAGSYYGSDFAFMPILSQTGPAAAPSNRYAFNTPFSHAHESARPGYYQVTLSNGINVELTATLHCGCGRFVYPKGQPVCMVVNAGSDITGTVRASVHIDPATRSISGSETAGHFLGHPNLCSIYFYAVFDRPFASFGAWSNSNLVPHAADAAGKTAGAYLIFDNQAGNTVLARAAISYVSVANARDNVERECPASRPFNSVVAAAESNWKQWLAKIHISGGASADRRAFYSMFYHTLLGPVVCSDANGEYRGYDGAVHQVEPGRDQYGYFSGWDVYRSECQFLAMIAPKEASDMAQSLLLDYQQGGAFPRWGLATEDSGVMDGDPAAPMIADFYAFGATNFDAQAALAGLLRAATNPAVMAPRNHIFERDALADYLKLGYVPEDQHGIWHSYGGVSLTLEFASADFALSQLAAALGHPTESARMLKQAQNWRNLFNPATGYAQSRRRDGSWAPGFANNVVSYDHNQAYQEGSAAQYVWMVPFDLQGLAEAMGGPGIAVARLDQFFTRLNDGVQSPFAYMGNEPCLETPWIYCFLGQPWKTQQVVHRILTLYSAQPTGYPGNDDLGEMSSWYVLAALGFYPELPGSDVLVLCAPIFRGAVLHLHHGDLRIEARREGDGRIYVKSLALNGQRWEEPWLRFPGISQGGSLVYTLEATPSNWGAAVSNTPPSYDF